MALLTATAVAASLLSAPSGPAAAGPAPATDPGAAAGVLPVDAEPVAVTLITGDTVQWQDAGDGNPRVVEIEQAPRDHPVTFDQSGTQDDFYVIPTDVMEQVVAGTVDRELFNIPGLIRQGLDDTATSELPVIVTFDQHRSTQQLTRDADALPATSNAQAVETMNGAGITVNRGKAGAFRQAVFGTPERDGSTRTAGARGLDGAVEQVLLDQVLHIDLAESVPQIGAPEAWDAGVTGQGVTVAVLDTGIDTGHPDLAGQVAAVENFTDEPDATDTHGHGTHVASTIAGTGAASDGARTGVAPGAELLSGKVCNTDGECQTSWIMAGMEWAAERADVVNMSLGSGSPSDGSDPLSQLVNELSAETGTLFVTSAGNLGNRDFDLRVVGAPGAADAALAVGAVDKSDRMADFSSRGPRVGDHAVKPEITAPGVGIVAARAEGTSAGSPVDDDYTSLNGTSMASPHVAGAAALLAQATGLAGGELKDALVSTTADGGFRWYAQGTGRVDVPAALDSPVYAQGTVNFGGIDGQAERDIVYTNRSDNDVTLTLQATATDLAGQPYVGITLSTDTLTVPAHGQAGVTATVTLDAFNVAGNTAFGGVVAATGPGVALRTGIGFGPPLHRVTIEVLDSHGHRIGSDTVPDKRVSLTHDTLDREVGGTEVYAFFTSEGIAVGRVPAGTYTIISEVLEEPEAPSEVARTSLLIEVEVDIAADSTITLDARDAVPITVSVPRKADKRNHGASVIRELAGAGGKVFTLNVQGGRLSMYATPAPPGELAPVSLFVTWTLAEPRAVQPLPWNGAGNCPRSPTLCYSDAPAYVYNLPILYENGIPDKLHEKIARPDLVEVPAHFHSEPPDALIMQQFESIVPLTIGPLGTRAVRMWFRPGGVTEYFLANDHGSWLRTIRIERRPEGEPPQSINMFSDDRFPVAEAGSRRAEERFWQAPLQVGVWDVRRESLDNPVLIERSAAASRNGPAGEWFAVPFQLMGNVRGHGGDAFKGASWRMWNADTGTELEQTGRVFPLAPGAATYRLEQVEDYPPSWPVLTGPATTTWTFTSRPSDAQVPQGYQCWIQQAPRQDVCQIQPLIRLEYDLGLDIHNRFSARRGAHVFTITAGHHSKAIDRAPIRSLRVQASFDDGDTWQDARVVGKPKDTWETGGFLPSAEPYQEFRVVLKIPPLQRTNGSVTLRVQATDANSGTVDQTIHRAYLLK
ncbi:MAG: S8 family serine peptidase [Micromonosporaceae bacterium]|nr:S8 family serine peptidase [Micromonosporaceae bacterium]